MAVLDDYRRLDLVHDGRRRSRRERLRPDKGHRAEWAALVDAVRAGEPAPIPFAEIVAAHLATFAATASLRDGGTVAVDADAFWSNLPS